VIHICMLTCNRRRITETSIRAIRTRTTTPHRLLVLDNGSVDGSADLVKALAAEGLVDGYELSPDNNGVHWGFNRLLELASSPLYVCTDNDIIPPVPKDGVDWLARLLALAERNLEFAAIACRPHVMIGDNADRMFADAPEIVQRDHVGAVLRLMRTDLVREVGGWRKVRQASRNNEEWYICGRLRKAGHRVGYARDVRVIHLFGEGDDEDPWGYPLGVEHGHKDRWPPVNHYGWERMRIDWETCEPEEG
jgi:GT2 family glycosyltransferase